MTLLIAIICGCVLPIPLGFFVSYLQERFGFNFALLITVLLSLLIIIGFYLYYINYGFISQ